MYEVQSFSGGPKTLLTALHIAALSVVAFCILGPGFETLSTTLGISAARGDELRGGLILVCSSIYFIRMLITCFVLLKRKMPWGEGTTIGVWLVVIHGTMLWLGGQNTQSVSVVTWAGLGIYCIGAYLNTGSEYQRMLWKRIPEHKGKLYTVGLFKYSMHVNYLGDVVAFTGFSMVAGSFYGLTIPAIMLILFIAVNIPMLDKYLAERYPDQFEAYASRTKKLIPFVY